MRLSILAGAIILALTVLSGLAYAENVIDDSDNPGYMLVLSAGSGSLEGDTLTLNGVHNVVYFSDRPAREAGHISVQNFVEIWSKGDESYMNDPPNAILSVLDKGGAQNVVVELNSVQRKNGALQYKVRVLEGNITGSFGTATMFVDPDTVAPIILP